MAPSWTQSGGSHVLIPLKWDVLALAEADSRGYVDIVTRMYVISEEPRNSSPRTFVGIYAGSRVGDDMGDGVGMLYYNSSLYSGRMRGYIVSSQGDGSIGVDTTYSLIDHITHFWWLRISAARVRCNVMEEYSSRDFIYGADADSSFSPPLSFVADHLMYHIALPLSTDRTQASIEVDHISISSDAIGSAAEPVVIFGS